MRRKQGRGVFKQLLIIFGGCCSLNLSAQVITDGSLGSAQSLNGPDFQIDASLGQQRGGNLFHSFQQFDLSSEQSAHFTGPSSVQNIISRITGGAASNLDGTVSVDIANANLYLINPAGFVFGANVQLDVSGDLHVSTASELQLGDGNRFYSDLNQASVLSSAPPSAFGFLQSTTGDVLFDGSQITTETSKSLSVSAGNIQARAAQLTAIAGQINLMAVQQAKSVSYGQTGIALSDGAVTGEVLLHNSTNIDVGKQIAGNIYIRSGRFELDNSEIIANTDGDIDGGIISIEADNLALRNRARIDSRTFGPSQSGHIAIKVTGTASLSISDILTTSRNTAGDIAGNAGDITLIVGELILDNSTISTDTFSSGNGGDIRIIASGDVQLLSQTNNPFFIVSAIQASSRNTADTAGDAGRISLTACNLIMNGENSRIENNTEGTGQGGNITLTLSESLQMRNGASITSESTGTGDAGNITVIAPQLMLQNSVISTETSQADGGNIIINAHAVFDLDSSDITATVNGGQGNGGNLTISNPWQFSATGSKLQANARGGNGGLILLVSGRPVLVADSVVSASSESGIDGEIKIDVPNVNLNALSIAFLDASQLIKQRCEVRTDEQFSSFIVSGQEGLPNAPDDLQSYLPSQQQLERLLGQ